MGSKILQKSALGILVLRRCGIDDKGAIAIADALKVNASLTELDLADNLIGSEGAIAIADALKVNTSLMDLNLIYNKIGREGNAALQKAEKSTKCRMKY